MFLDVIGLYFKALFRDEKLTLACILFTSCLIGHLGSSQNLVAPGKWAAVNVDPCPSLTQSHQPHTPDCMCSVDIGHRRVLDTRTNLDMCGRCLSLLLIYVIFR